MPPPKDAGKLFNCPHCQAGFRFTGVGAIAMPSQSPSPLPFTRRPGFGKALRSVSIAALSIVGICALFPVRAPAKAPADARREAQIRERVTAFYMARVYVKETLIAPGSAQFVDPANPANAALPTLDGHYWVNGAVDSQNRFGVFLRMNYHVELHRVTGTKGGDDGTWYLDEIKINER